MNRREVIHVARVKKYCVNMELKKVPEEFLGLANQRAAKYDVVENIIKIA